MPKIQDVIISTYHISSVMAYEDIAPEDALKIVRVYGSSDAWSALYVDKTAGLVVFAKLFILLKELDTAPVFISGLYFPRIHCGRGRESVETRAISEIAHSICGVDRDTVALMVGDAPAATIPLLHHCEPLTAQAE